MPSLRLRWVFLFLFITVCMQAQFTDYGSDPGRLKWNYVKTDHYKIIYPRGIDSIAYLYTQFLENVYPHLDKTIGYPVKGRYPTVLHPGNMLSNGMVSWAPRRMELITTPSSDLYAQSWDRQLSIHESRHVFQTGKLMKGIFRPLYYLGGEQVLGLADFAVPRWFFEGDATVIETAMSNSSRGRLPEFNMYYRTRLLRDEFFSFDKWFMGSYKDYTGSFYALGYDMVAYARYAHGADIWDKVTGRYTRRILHLPPFSGALNYYTGLNTQRLFNETFRFLGEEWKEQYRTAGPFTPGTQITPLPHTYTSYQYPQALPDGRVIVAKSSFSDLQSLVLLKEGKEQFLSYIGNRNSRLILNNNRIYWTEYVSGLRWTHENYSVLKYLDLETNRIHTLTPRKRYIAPAISPDGKQAAVSQYAWDGENTVVILDTGTGNEIVSYPAPPHAFLKELAWDNDLFIVALGVSDAGLSLCRLEQEPGEWTELIAPGPANISSLTASNGNLYFESGANGINNIYRYDTKENSAYRITSARFGMFQPEVSNNGEELFVADYQPQGYAVVSISGEELIEEKTDFASPYRFTLAETVAQQEAFNLDTATLVPIAFNPKPYRKATHLFNIHSWAPFYYDVNDAINLNTDDFTTIVKPGATVISQNQLNTAITQAGFYYKDKEMHGKLSFTYMGWYPVFELETDYGRNAFNMYWLAESSGLNYTHPGRKRFEAEAKVYIPFNFTHNHYVQGLQPALTYYYTNNKYQQIRSGKLRDFQYLLAELRFYRYRKMAQKDILPKWGYQLRLQYLHTPLQTENYSDLYAARLITYWPGILRNHSLMLRAGYQYQPAQNKAMYLPTHCLETPRGYNYNYRNYQQYLLRGDYAFSLFCPDFSLGALAYIRRVRTNLFYDIARTQSSKGAEWTNQSAYGADLICDWNIFRLDYPISLGIRVINPVNHGNVQAEALFSVSF